MPTLALSMIVKNAAATLARCLDSVQGIVDEIVIADTGSTDKTLEIARSYGANVFSIAWEGDFAKARNLSLAKVRSDWVLVMDADEMLDPEAGRLMPPHLEPESAMGYTVLIRNYVDNVNCHLWDQPAQPNTNPPPFAAQYPGYLEHVNVRLFRRRPDVCFQGAVHETVGYRLFELGGRIEEAKFIIHHFGFLDSQDIRSSKSNFYRELGRQKIRELPDNALAHYELGVEESEHFHDYEAALPLFKRACELNPRFGPGWLFYGRTLSRLGKYREALQVLEHASETSVREESLLEAEGDVHYSFGNLEETCRRYERVLESGEKPQVESKLGFAQVRQGRKQEGLHRLQSAIGREPENADLHDRLIAAHVWLGELGKAAEAAEAKLGRVKPQAESFLRAASLRAQLQDWHRTLVLVRLGLDAFPDDAKLKEARAEALARAAAAQTESKGDAEFRAGLFDSACRSYEQAIERLGSSPVLESKLGLAEVRSGKPEEGLARLRAAVESEPGTAEPHDRLIAAFVWLGRLQEAADSAEIKLNSLEPSPELYLRAASLEAQLRDWTKAASFVYRGLDQFPENEKLLNAAEEIAARDPVSGPVFRDPRLGARDSQCGTRGAGSRARHSGSAIG